MKGKKIRLIATAILLLLLSMMAVWYKISPNINPLLERMQSAANNPGKYGYLFNKEGELKYTDLSPKLRKKIAKEEFESIENYIDAQKIFNAACEDIKHLPIKHIEIDKPILVEVIWINGKEYLVEQYPVIGFEGIVKPVVVHWYMDIYPY